MSTLRHFGKPLKEAAGAVILLHGRGGSAADILTLAVDLYLPQLAYLAPQAPGNTWYPNSFLAPIAQNEPWLSASLDTVAACVKTAEDAGITADRIVIGGFSQGACLSSEFVARNPRRYAGLLAFTGGLIGPPGADLSHEGDLQGTPALFATGDPDPHVPFQRVKESAEILAKMGATVTTKRYPNRPHTVSAEEIGLAKRLIEGAFSTLALTR
jgi:phospholipase/carboxylesterase